jgi:hypothetical protein
MRQPDQPHKPTHVHHFWQGSPLCTVVSYTHYEVCLLQQILGTLPYKRQGRNVELFDGASIGKQRVVLRTQHERADLGAAGSATSVMVE